jgi:hypothetical protein
MTSKPTVPPKQDDQADGDYVPYGFGHPAHLPDPNATYGFDPQPERLLPVKPEKRWRLPG